MKKKVKVFTLVFGVIVAIIAFSNTNSYADNKEQKLSTDVLTIETKTLYEVEKLIQPTQIEPKTEKRIKIFNSANQLIYECRSEDDQRLCMLLRRSDLILQTDSSSYYLLGD